MQCWCHVQLDGGSYAFHDSRARGIPCRIVTHFGRLRSKHRAHSGAEDRRIRAARDAAAAEHQYPGGQTERRRRLERLDREQDADENRRPGRFERARAATRLQDRREVVGPLLAANPMYPNHGGHMRLSALAIAVSLALGTALVTGCDRNTTASRGSSAAPSSSTSPSSPSPASGSSTSPSSPSSASGSTTSPSSPSSSGSGSMSSSPSATPPSSPSSSSTDQEKKDAAGGSSASPSSSGSSSK